MKTTGFLRGSGEFFWGSGGVLGGFLGVACIARSAFDNALLIKRFPFETRPVTFGSDAVPIGSGSASFRFLPAIGNATFSPAVADMGFACWGGDEDVCFSLGDAAWEELAEGIGHLGDSPAALPCPPASTHLGSPAVAVVTPYIT